MTAESADAGIDGVGTLRILHLGKFLPPHAGGIERFLAELMPALRRENVRSAALVHASRSGQALCRRQHDALVVSAPVTASLAFTPISPSWPCRLQRLIKRLHPDLLHLHLPNPSAFWAMALPGARRLPWIVHWHADVPVDAADWRLRLLYRFYKPLESSLLRRAALIVATSQAYARSSRALQPFLDKTVVVPLGLSDQQRAAPLPVLWPARPSMKLLFVGRFSYYKGLDVLLRALVGTEGIDLLLVGQGDQQLRLQQLIAELRLGAQVRFAGALDDHALAGAYAAADVLCLPSIERSEAFGMVLLEAMRTGIATIATSVPGSGMAEVLAGGEVGRLVEAGDADQLRQVLIELRDNPALRLQLAEAGHQRFMRNYRIEAVAAALAQHYRALADNR